MDFISTTDEYQCVASRSSYTVADNSSAKRWTITSNSEAMSGRNAVLSQDAFSSYRDAELLTSEEF